MNTFDLFFTVVIGGLSLGALIVVIGGLLPRGRGTWTL